MNYFFSKSKIFLILTFFLLGIFLFSSSASAETNGLLFLASEQDVTPGTAGSWQTVDVSSYVPSGATGAILRMVNTDSVNRDIRIRKPGSLDNFTNTKPIPNAHLGAIVGLDVSRAFQAYIGSTLVKIYLVGYTDDAVVLLTNYQFLVGYPATGTAWADYDLSPYIPTDASGIITFIYDENVGANGWGGVRKNGSNDTFPYTEVSYSQSVYQVSGVDANRMIEIQRSTNGSVYLVGYFKAPVSFETNGVDYSLTTTGSWQDISVTLGASPVNANGALWMIRSNNYSYSGGVRKYGSSDESYGGFYPKGARFFATALDASRRAQSKIENTLVDHYVIGYVSGAPPAGDTTPPTRSNGQPTGALAAGTTQTTISLTTNESATCRYSTSTSISYSSMINNFSTTGSTVHSTLVTGLANGSSYNYYVRCQDVAGNANTDDYPISFSVASAPATGNVTTVGGITLTATFKSISIYSGYTGDDNDNSQATVEYKEKTATVWKQAHPLYIDRGVWIRSENRYTNRQGKGSIVMLNQNTEYDVRVTYTDSDGVNGTNPVTASIKTRDESSPIGTGNNYYVATSGNDNNPGTDALPFRTIQKAVSLLQAGDTVYIKAGTYTETISIYGPGSPSGTASNYITVRNYGNDEVIIDGGCSLANNINLGGSRGYAHGGNYIRISGLTLKNANAAAVSLDDIPGIWIENNQIIDFNCADLLGQQYGAVGAWDTTDLVIRNNIISRNVGVPVTTCNVVPPANDAIWIKNNGYGRGGGHIIYNNKISGNNRDGVGGEPEGPSYGSLYKDTDIYNNEVTGCADDGIQTDSGGINIRVWNNTIRNCQCSGFSLSPASEGPLYIFRNVISGLLVNGGISGYKEGSAGNGRAYLYHNSAYVWNSDVYGGGARETNMVYKNNIISAGRYAYESPSWPPYDFDYNVLYETDPGRFIYWMSISYGTLSSFQTATGQDLNSINADPLFIDQVNGNLRLQSSSPAIDKGVVIANFNDADSVWPYRGAAPDIGYFEYDSGAPPPSFTISSVSPLYLFRDQTNTLSITGSNFNLATNFYLRFTSGGTAISSITTQTQSSSIFNISMTSSQVNTLPVGFYDLRLERSTDNQSQTYSQQMLVTTLGDISSQTAGIRDGKVNIYDVSRMLSKWGSTFPADLTEADINAGPGNISQGRIDLYDANKMMVNWRP
jgi:hypothetical protein